MESYFPLGLNHALLFSGSNVWKWSFTCSVISSGNSHFNWSSVLITFNRFTGTLLTEPSSVLFLLLSFPQSPRFDDWDSLRPPCRWLKRFHSHLNPSFNLMNSGDLVPLLVVQNKSNTEQTSMIKSDWITTFLFWLLFTTTLFVKDQKRGRSGDVLPLWIS